MMNFLRRLFLTIVVWFVLVLVALQIASNFFLAPLLEREGRKIFKTPVRVEKARLDVLTGSLWMKGVRIKNAEGFQEPDFFSAKRVLIDLSFLGLLTNEFVVSQVRLDEPTFVIETNLSGDANALAFANRVFGQLQKFSGKRWGPLRQFTQYALEKFSIRSGLVQFVDQHNKERKWSLNPVSLSLARVVYPPDPEEALPAAVYLNASVEGARTGKVLALGRVNFFAKKASFDITGSLKDIVLSEYSQFLGNFPLRFSEGVLQLKVKALCHENQIDLYHQITIDKPKFADLTAQNAPPSEKGKSKEQLAFGLPPETVIYFFNQLREPNKPLELDFHVTGDLSDPKFSVFRGIQAGIDRAIQGMVTEKMEAIREETKQIAEEALLKLTSAAPSLEINHEEEKTSSERKN